MKKVMRRGILCFVTIAAMILSILYVPGNGKVSAATYPRDKSLSNNVDGWHWEKTADGRTRFVNDDGTVLKCGDMDYGIRKIDNVLYAFDKDGYRIEKKGWNVISTPGVTGTLNIYNQENMYKFWFYVADDNSLKTGWLLDGNDWYYINSSGFMVSGDTYNVGSSDNPDYYVFDNSGRMLTNGWIHYRNEDASWMEYWAYGDDSGKACVGWRYIDGVWYSFDNHGCMYNSFTDNLYESSTGSMKDFHVDVYYEGYYMDDNGVCGSEVYSWHSDNGKWWYGNDGYYERSSVAVIDGRLCYFDNDGYWREDMDIYNHDTGDFMKIRNLISTIGN